MVFESIFTEKILCNLVVDLVGNRFDMRHFHSVMKMGSLNITPVQQVDIVVVPILSQGPTMMWLEPSMFSNL